MTKAQFRGPVLAGHQQAAVEVPFDPAKQWSMVAASIRAGRRGFKVKGTFAGVPFQGFVVPRSKRFWVLVEDEQLKVAGVAVGDSVTILLEPLST